MSDDRLYRIEDKIDKISDRVSSIDKTLAEQHLSLKEHIKRTNLLEAEVRPIKKHVTMLQGAMRLIGALAGASALIKIIVELSKGA